MSEGYDTPAPRDTELGNTELGTTELGTTEFGATEHGGTEHGGTEHGGTEHGGTEHGGTGFDLPGEGVYAVTPSGYTDPPVATGGSGLASGTGTGTDSTTGVAADQAKQVGQDVLASGQQVAGVAADQAKTVAAEAGSQARNLVGEARTQLTDQAATQQNNLATWLHSIVDELDEMVGRGDGSQHSGQATSLVRQVSGRARGAASWLEDHEPSDLLAETSRFARRRPGLFLALAAAGGLLAGRLTRGLTADSSSSAGSHIGAAETGPGQQVVPPITTTASAAVTSPYATPAPVYGAVEPAGALGDDDLAVSPSVGSEGDLGPDHGVR